MNESLATILVVHDDPIKRYTLRRTLEQVRYRVLEEGTGAAGLERAAASPQPDLVLLDVVLPDIDGFEVCRRLKAGPRTQRIPVLQMSATFTQSDHRVLGLDSGADAFLVDQTRPQEWVATVRALLRARAAEEGLRGQNARLRMLADVTSRLLLDEQPDANLGELYRALAVHLRADAIVHYAVDDPPRTLRRLAGAGAIDGEFPAEVDLGRDGADAPGTVAGDWEPLVRSARSRRPVVCAAAADVPPTASPTPAESAPRTGFGSLVVHPLPAGAGLIGVVAVGRRAGDPFDEDDRTLLQTVCQQVATALERQRLRDGLKARNEQLADAARRKDEFLAMLGHELRNPLAAIVHAIQLLQARPDGDDRALAITAADEQVRHLTHLVDDLLDVARITQGKIRLQTAPIDLRATVAAAVRQTAPLMAGLGHELTIATPDEPLIVEGDSTRIEQVLVNLLTNAAKYTDGGGQVRLDLTRAGDRAVLTVSDNGLGIAPEQLPRLFVLFNQVSQSLDRSQGGLGVGLVLVKTLVELHWGRVTVASDGLGRGSTFTIELPVRASDAAPTPPSPADGPSGRRRSILIVDDNAAAAQLLALVLRAGGHQVTVVHDGLAAVETAPALRPQVVLLDIGLPKLNGFEVAERLRREPGLADTALVAVSGYAPEGTMQASFDAYLVKPVRIDELKAVLNSLTLAARPG